MPPLATFALAAGGVLSALAALAHLACIVIGAPAYRLMGAGERMARAVEKGALAPTLVTMGIASALAIAAWYAFSGAGLVTQMPARRAVLVAIAAVYVARGLAFPLIKRLFPDNSDAFWLVSSALCLLMGGLHVVGLVAAWDRL